MRRGGANCSRGARVGWPLCKPNPNFQKLAAVSREDGGNAVRRSVSRVTKQVLTHFKEAIQGEQIVLCEYAGVQVEDKAMPRYQRPATRPQIG